MKPDALRKFLAHFLAYLAAIATVFIWFKCVNDGHIADDTKRIAVVAERIYGTNTSPCQNPRPAHFLQSSLASRVFKRNPAAILTKTF